jgi:3-hydroxyisobutyrate dehydrogenase-like beta-hydroxyacid dehydrogenase
MASADQAVATREGAHMNMTVGVIGLGAMGRPMAEHLVDAGVPTTVLDADEETQGHVVARGATGARSPREVGDNDVILVIVPTDDDVRSVCYGEDGLLASPKDGAVIVINASVTLELCEEIAEAAAKVGVSVLDAALTGGVRGADNGEINLLVGGDEKVLDSIRPVLEPWTKAVHHLGPLGSGQVGKTVNNLCHWIQISGIHEALLLGRRLGVAPSKLREALYDSPANSTTLHEIQEMRFTWWKKDIDNARKMAAPIGYEMPMTEQAYLQMAGITPDRISTLLISDQDPDEGVRE